MEKEANAESEEPELSAYERQRLENIKRNKEVLAKLGLGERKSDSNSGQGRGSGSKATSSTERIYTSMTKRARLPARFMSNLAMVYSADQAAADFPAVPLQSTSRF